MLAGTGDGCGDRECGKCTEMFERTNDMVEAELQDVSVTKETLVTRTNEDK